MAYYPFHEHEKDMRRPNVSTLGLLKSSGKATWHLLRLSET